LQVDVLDGDRLIYQLLRRGLPETLAVYSSIDVKAVESYPLLTFRSTGGAGLTNGGSTMPQAWLWDADLILLHTDYDELRVIAGHVYDLVHSWGQDPWADESGVIPGLIPGLGHATAVTDRSLFSRVNEADVGGHTVTQVLGSFSMQLHQA
jgi:hypothetical protein